MGRKVKAMLDRLQDISILHKLAIPPRRALPLQTETSVHCISSTLNMTYDKNLYTSEKTR
jgi:hypothetical protein